jgi:parallel beta-helix repeat protein
MSTRFICLVCLIVFSVGILTQKLGCGPVKAALKTWTVDDNGPADFSTIVEAINGAGPGDTIYVHNGTYASANEGPEGLLLDKPLTLIGECVNSTVITKSVHIYAPRVTLTGFAITSVPRAGPGVLIDRQSETTVSGNLIYSPGGDAVEMRGGNCNRIVSNTMLESSGVFVIWTSTDNLICDNTIVGGWYGVYISGGSRNLIFNNTIKNMEYAYWLNGGGGILIGTLGASDENSIYGNNFINNKPQVYDFSWDNPHLPSSVNSWDNGYPSGGNYWSDYVGIDVKMGPNQDQLGSDGIGDTPYTIDGSNADRYPLMYPVGSQPPPAYVPVGGYSYTINGDTTEKTLTLYLGLVALLSTARVVARKKNARE